MCKHRSAIFVTRKKGLCLLVCTAGCHQPFWKDAKGKEVKGKKLIKALETQKG